MTTCSTQPTLPAYQEGLPSHGWKTWITNHRAL